MRAAIGAEVPRPRPLKIAARELLRRPFDVAEAVERHHHEHVRGAAGNILAFPAMALPLAQGLAFGRIAQLPTIATALEFHRSLPLSAAVSRCALPRFVFKVALRMRRRDAK